VGETVHDRAVLLHRICAWPQCQSVFYICSHCDRGHRYCSDECRERARLQQQRCANRRHQGSVAGRLDHRDRQSSYRQRKRLLMARVTYHTSPSTSVPAEWSQERTSAVAPATAMADDLKPQPRFWRCCRICGRWMRAFLHSAPCPPVEQNP